MLCSLKQTKKRLTLASIYSLLTPLEHKLSNYPLFHFILVAQTVKNPPEMQETQVLSLGWEDLREKGMATHSSIRAWRIPWTEEPGGLQSMGLQRVGHN